MFKCLLKGKSGDSLNDYAYGGNIVKDYNTGKVYLCNIDNFTDKTLLKDALTEVEENYITKVADEKNLSDFDIKQISKYIKIINAKIYSSLNDMHKCFESGSLNYSIFYPGLNMNKKLVNKVEYETNEFLNAKGLCGHFYLEDFDRGDYKLEIHGINNF